MKIVIKVVTNWFVVYVFFLDSVLWITTSASNRTHQRVWYQDEEWYSGVENID